jgi:hypothetical protein
VKEFAGSDDACPEKERSEYADRRADNQDRRRYINPPGTSGLLAFGLEKTDDGIDTIERWAG